MSRQSPAERAAIVAMGTELRPELIGGVFALYRAEQERHVRAQPPSVADQPYGPHARQRLDLYAPANMARAPALLWVHGGGFVTGEKSSADHPFNAHIGRWAARNGLLGAVMNYRLAPEARWPSGGEDVALAIEWLRENAVVYGGDPTRIVVAGTSAGAVHVATFLQLHPDPTSVRAAILFSGFYGYTPLDEHDTLYYGARSLYADRMPRAALETTSTPLFAVCSEHDPARYRAETLALLSACLARTGAMPRAMIVPGHNHFSLPAHLGGADTRLADEMLAFIRERTA